MVRDDSWWFLLVLGDSCWFLVFLGDSLWFFVNSLCFFLFVFGDFW